jgi:hypothetical protein
MMIVDAVHSAPTPTAVYFLLTAYLESLRHFQCTCGVPERTLDLPVMSATDLRQRLDLLEHASGTFASPGVVIDELAAVIRCALERLEETDDTRSTHNAGLVTYRVRSDNPHSSPSV